MKLARAWTLAVVIVGALVAGSGAAPAEEGGPDAEVRKAVRAVMEKLQRNEKGLVLGLSRAEARKIAAGAANQGEEYSTTLGGTDYDPGVAVPGVLRFFAGGPKKVVSEVSVTLLAKYDVEAMGRHVQAVGKELGLDLVTGEEDPRTYFDAGDDPRSLWVALGDGVVVIEIDT
jgi:hypothetical protein